jgi:colicin import membrane protein
MAAAASQAAAGSDFASSAGSCCGAAQAQRQEEERMDEEEAEAWEDAEEGVAEPESADAATPLARAARARLIETCWFREQRQALEEMHAAFRELTDGGDGGGGCRGGAGAADGPRRRAVAPRPDPQGAQQQAPQRSPPVALQRTARPAATQRSVPRTPSAARCSGGPLAAATSAQARHPASPRSPIVAAKGAAAASRPLQARAADEAWERRAAARREVLEEEARRAARAAQLEDTIKAKAEQRRRAEEEVRIGGALLWW